MVDGIPSREIPYRLYFSQISEARIDDRVQMHISKAPCHRLQEEVGFRKNSFLVTYVTFKLHENTLGQIFFIQESKFFSITFSPQTYRCNSARFQPFCRKAVSKLNTQFVILVSVA